MFDKLFQKESFRAGLVSALLLILAIIMQLSSMNFMKAASKNVLAPVKSADSIQYTIINTSLNTVINKQLIIKNQYIIGEKIKSYYKGIGESYFVNYYAFSICSIIFSTLLTIAVFLVANKGWQNSSIMLKSFLLSNIVLTSIYYFLPNVLSNKENLRNNIEKVRVYQELQSDILTFSNKINKVNDSEIDSAITSNYKKLSGNLDYFNTIDNSELNNEVSNLLKKAKNGN